MSPSLKKQADALIRYCQLRILSYNCFYRRLTDTTNTFQADSLEIYNYQIRSLLDSLKGN